MNIEEFFKGEGFKVVGFTGVQVIKQKSNPIIEDRESVKLIFGITEEELVEKENKLFDLEVKDGFYVYTEKNVFCIMENDESISSIMCYGMESDKNVDKDFIEYKMALAEYAAMKQVEAFKESFKKSSSGMFDIENLANNLFGGFDGKLH